MGSRTSSSDRINNANGYRVSVFSAHEHFRYKLYRDGSIRGGSLFCGMPQGMLTHKPILDLKIFLLHNLVIKYFVNFRSNAKFFSKI